MAKHSFFIHMTARFHSSQAIHLFKLVTILLPNMSGNIIVVITVISCHPEHQTLTGLRNF